MCRQLLICFDVDGTLVDDTVFIWQTLHEAVGTDPAERERWADAFWNKEITYSEWARKDIEMWREKGVGRREILRCTEKLKPMEGAWDSVCALHRDGHTLGVISGSLDIVFEQAFPDWRAVFSYVFLNRLQFDESGALMDIHATPYDIEHKADGLKEMAALTGIPLQDTVFIGDNFNDVSVARKAGMSIAFNCKSDALSKTATVTTSGKDLRVILPLIREFSRNGAVRQR